ncbi:MAG: threonine synthase, partial [Acidaminococcaceae bacterium]|nr:threonine synthase [Acidaminococcaceae bacterium]
YIIVLSTASPYKFCSTVLKGIGKGDGTDTDSPFDTARRLSEATEMPVPKQVSLLEEASIRHKDVIDAGDMAINIKKALEIS